MTDVNEMRTAAAPSRRSRSWMAAVALAVVLGVAGLGLWRYFARPISPQLAILVERLASDPNVVAPADVRNCVHLTGPFAGLSARDEMYLNRREDGSFLAMFPTYYGSGTTAAFLLYTSRPLRSSDTYMRQRTLGQATRAIDVNPYQDLVFDDRIDDHWYRVSYGIH